MEEIKAYKPKCCKKLYFSKYSALRHEKKCFCNPDNKACLSCGNFMTDYNTVYVRPQGDGNYGDDDYEQRYNYCECTGKTFGNETDEQQWKRDCCQWIPKAVTHEN